MWLWTRNHACPSLSSHQSSLRARGFGWNRENSCSHFGKSSSCSCKNKTVLPPTSRCCLDLQRRELQAGGMGEADQDCDKGTTAACSIPDESHVLKDCERGRARYFVQKAAMFYCSKNTHYTRSLMNKTKYSSQRKSRTKQRTGTDKHSAVVQVIHCRKDTAGTANTLYWGGSFPPQGFTHPQRGRWMHLHHSFVQSLHLHHFGISTA